MAEISISIESKYFGSEHKVITLKQQFLAHWSATVMNPLGKIQRAYIALYHILLYVR